MTAEIDIPNQDNVSTAEASIIHVASEAKLWPQTELSQLVNPKNLTRTHVFALCAGKAVQINYIQTEIGVSTEQIRRAFHAEKESDRWYTQIPPRTIRKLINKGGFDPALIRSGDNSSYYRPFGTSLFVLRARRGIDWINLDIFPSSTFFQRKGKSIFSDLITETTRNRAVMLKNSGEFEVHFSPRSIVDETISKIDKPYKTDLPKNVTKYLHEEALNILLSGVPALAQNIQNKGFRIIDTGHLRWAINSNGSEDPDSLTVSVYNTKVKSEKETA